MLALPWQCHTRAACNRTELCGVLQLSEPAAGASELVAALRGLLDADPSQRVPELREGDLSQIGELVNSLADRVEEDRARLAANIRSLDATNRELHAARDQVVRSARLASAGTLAAGIAHEIGNPLGAIMGFVDVARARAQRDGSDTELLESIRHEAGRIDRIVRGLLDYARPSSDTRQPSSVADVLQDVHELLQNQGKLSEADVSLVMESGSAELVDHPGQLEQVLVNLLLNALHAVRGSQRPLILVRLFVEDGLIARMPERREADPPEVDYRHRRRRAVTLDQPASVAGADRVLAIEVLDNGEGFPEGVPPDLFDPFYTTKAPGEGTGLGLSICARLVEGMGGTIEASGRETGGARFVLRLPAVHDDMDPLIDADEGES